jgi:hypothetical protein
VESDELAVERHEAVQRCRAGLKLLALVPVISMVIGIIGVTSPWLVQVFVLLLDGVFVLVGAAAAVVMIGTGALRLRRLGTVRLPAARVVVR